MEWRVSESLSEESWLQSMQHSSRHLYISTELKPGARDELEQINDEKTASKPEFMITASSGD